MPVRATCCIPFDEQPDECQHSPNVVHKAGDLHERMTQVASAQWSREAERDAVQHRVKHVVLPQFGARSQARRGYAEQGWFVRGRRWRTGIEGRSSVLKRRHKLARCLDHGRAGRERWVGWGVIAHDLHQIAAAV